MGEDIWLLPVQPLSMVDKSDLSPPHLTFPLEAPYSCFSEVRVPSCSFQVKRMLHEPPDVSARDRAHLLVFRCCVPMAFLIMVWSGPEQKTRYACRFIDCSSRAPPTIVPPVDSPLLPSWVEDQYLRMSRPWCEVKSRRGAPKRIPTEGFACPNRQCLYFGNTDARVHASFWGWQAWPGRTDPGVPRPCLPHHVQRSTRYSAVPSENSRAPGRHGALCPG